MSANGQTEQEKQRATWFATLLLRSLPLSDSLEEALEATEVALSVQPGPPPAPSSVALSLDIFSPQARKVLKRSLKAMLALSEEAQGDLKKALSGRTKLKIAEGLVEFLRTYRLRLSALLGSTTLSALLEGAREVVGNMPTIPALSASEVLPPSLSPPLAVSLLLEFEGLSEPERLKKILTLPPDQQHYLDLALSDKPVLPPALLPDPLEPPADGMVHFPAIEEGVRLLAEKNVLDKPSFDRLDAAARLKAFTVSGVEAQATLEKIRDTLVDNIEEGADLVTFRKAILESTEEGTFLSEGHLQQVFRDTVQTAYSDGQMKVLEHPFVQSGFPYARYESIADSRRRTTHAYLQTAGIQGTNIYRINDPVFIKFRPPWEWCDRCSWFPITIRQAAEEGIEEAIAWLATGIEPTPPAFVPMPPFEPPAAFQRALALSIDDWDIGLGMVGDEWHGPRPPGPGWVQAGQGPHGGKVWKKSGGSTDGAPRDRPSSVARVIENYIVRNNLEDAVLLFEQTPEEDKPRVWNSLNSGAKGILQEESSKKKTQAADTPQQEDVAPTPPPGTLGGEPLQVPALAAQGFLDEIAEKFGLSLKRDVATFENKSLPLGQRLNSIANLDTTFIDRLYSNGELKGVRRNNEYLRSVNNAYSAWERGIKRQGDRDRLAGVLDGVEADVKKAVGKMQALADAGRPIPAWQVLPPVDSALAAIIYEKYGREAIAEVREKAGLASGATLSIPVKVERPVAGQRG